MSSSNLRYFSKIILGCVFNPKRSNSSTSTLIKDFFTKQPIKLPQYTHNLLNATEIKAYDALLPIVIQTITNRSSEVPDFTQRFERLMNLFFPNEMIIEGLKVVELYKAIAPTENSENHSEENMHLARTLGWCLDLFTCSFQIAEDIVDNSNTRWGKPCLHNHEDIKLYAINDSMLLKHSVHAVLKEFCSKHTWYTSCCNLMDLVALKTSAGIAMDKMWKSKFEFYTSKKYRQVSEYKRAYQGVLMPVMLASYCSGNYDDELFDKAKDVIRELGTFLSTQDDMADYEHSIFHLDSSSDISEGRLTWLVVQAIEKASQNQKQLIYQNYGKKEMVNVIKNLYDELNILKLYSDYKESSFKSVYRKMKTLPIEESHKRLFYALIEILYRKPQSV